MVVQIQNSIGYSYFMKKDYKTAQKYLLEAYNFSHKIKYYFTTCYASANLGYVGIITKDFNKAETYLKESLTLATKIKEQRIKYRALQALADLYFAKGEAEKGFEYQEKSNVVRDSLTSANNSKALADFEVKYKTSQKEAEIANQKLEISNQRQWILGISSLFLLSALGFGLFYINRQAKQKAIFDAEKLKFQTEKTSAIVEAEEKERIRLAKELHDGVGPMISLAKMQLETAMSLTKFENIEQESNYQNTKTMIDEVATEIRNVSHDLMPNALLIQGLVSAVREFVNRLSLTGKVKVSLDVANLEQRLPQLTETVLYRVLQELVGNVVKHSQAKNVQIQLIRNENELTMMVEDDGVGFNSAQINDYKGIGIKNIISRIEFLNGNVNFDSALNRGTTVIVEVPL